MYGGPNGLRARAEVLRPFLLFFSVEVWVAAEIAMVGTSVSRDYLGSVRRQRSRPARRLKGGVVAVPPRPTTGRLMRKSEWEDHVVTMCCDAWELGPDVTEKVIEGLEFLVAAN